MIIFDYKGLEIGNMDFTTWVNYLIKSLEGTYSEDFGT
jgi:hypothetical protein